METNMQYESTDMPKWTLKLHASANKPNLSDSQVLQALVAVFAPRLVKEE